MKKVIKLTFFPWSQDGERPVPANHQPRLIPLHTHVDIRIPEDDDNANEQKTRPDPSSEVPFAVSPFIVFGGYSVAVISKQGRKYLLPRLPEFAYLTLQQIPQAGENKLGWTLPQTWGGEEEKKRKIRILRTQPQAVELFKKY